MSIDNLFIFVFENNRTRVRNQFKRSCREIKGVKNVECRMIKQISSSKLLYQKPFVCSYKAKQLKKTPYEFSESVDVQNGR